LLIWRCVLLQAGKEVKALRAALKAANARLERTQGWAGRMAELLAGLSGDAVPVALE
jgi:hypothetical protein